jgi:acetyltransferase-like isoleucine patch superfamily enzyme
MDMKKEWEIQPHGTKRKPHKMIRSFLCTRYLCRQAAEVGSGSKANAIVKATKNTYIGECSNFNGMTIQGRGKVTIGSYFHSGQDIHIITDVHHYEGEQIPYDAADVVKEVVIGDFVWIGSHVIILGGVSIGEGAIIQAGAVVVNDIPPCAIAGGNPAKVFKYRDIEHFQKLKEEKKFH